MKLPLLMQNLDVNGMSKMKIPLRRILRLVINENTTRKDLRVFFNNVEKNVSECLESHNAIKDIIDTTVDFYNCGLKGVILFDADTGRIDLKEEVE